MDEATIRRRIARHASALVAGDVSEAGGDFAEELRARAAEIVAQLPPAIGFAELTKLEPADGGVVARVRFSGPGAEATVEERWEQRGTRPQIVAIRVVGQLDEGEG
ncbi:MAG: hypothetical protein ACRDNY_02040 [Gaiellaceae bacterium]